MKKFVSLLCFTSITLSSINFASIVVSCSNSRLIDKTIKTDMTEISIKNDEKLTFKIINYKNLKNIECQSNDENICSVKYDDGIVEVFAHSDGLADITISANGSESTNVTVKSASILNSQLKFIQSASFLLKSILPENLDIDEFSSIINSVKTNSFLGIVSKMFSFLDLQNIQDLIKINNNSIDAYNFSIYKNLNYNQMAIVSQIRLANAILVLTGKENSTNKTNDLADWKTCISSEKIDENELETLTKKSLDSVSGLIKNIIDDEFIIQIPTNDNLFYGLNEAIASMLSMLYYVQNFYSAHKDEWDNSSITFKDVDEYRQSSFDINDNLYQLNFLNNLKIINQAFNNINGIQNILLLMFSIDDKKIGDIISFSLLPPSDFDINFFGFNPILQKIMFGVLSSDKVYSQVIGLIPSTFSELINSKKLGALGAIGISNLLSLLGNGFDGENINLLKSMAVTIKWTDGVDMIAQNLNLTNDQINMLHDNPLKLLYNDKEDGILKKLTIQEIITLLNLNINANKYFGIIKDISISKLLNDLINQDNGKLNFSISAINTIINSLSAASKADSTLSVYQYLIRNISSLQDEKIWIDLGLTNEGKIIENSFFYGLWDFFDNQSPYYLFDNLYNMSSYLEGYYNK